MFRVLHLNPVVNNTIDWIICVAFQFFTNRTWVFDGKVETKAEFIKQAGSFTVGRLFTLVVEDLITLGGDRRAGRRKTALTQALTNHCEIKSAQCCQIKCD